MVPASQLALQRFQRIEEDLGPFPFLILGGGLNRRVYGPWRAFLVGSYWRLWIGTRNERFARFDDGLKGAG